MAQDLDNDETCVTYPRRIKFEWCFTHPQEYFTYAMGTQHASLWEKPVSALGKPMAIHPCPTQPALRIRHSE